MFMFYCVVILLLLSYCFIVMQEVERMEKENEAAEKPVKLGKLGKHKAKKPAIDALPSPMGRRVVPKISSAVKAKGEKDAAKKLFRDRVCSFFCV